MSKGFVYLVGAGIGDPELITVRGWRLLQSADVVLYDRLIPQALLAEARPDALLIDVGKAPTKERLSQSIINQWLIEHAQAGKQVVRLKGGDPFVFGLGGEEGLALASAEIPFEVVPGVSSLTAVPAYAGIPVTHRGFATSVVVLSGHDLESETWKAIPRSGTIVVFMGAGKLAKIVELLFEAGYSADTPIAILLSGGTPQQKQIIGRLATILAQTAELPPPALIVIGEVVSLHELINWYR